MIARSLIVLALVLSGPAALACSLTPMGASTLQMEGVLNYVGEKHAFDQATVRGIEAMTFNTFRVTFVAVGTQNVTVRKYAVGIGANCKTTVKEIQQ
ncbi:MAG TPA: hypothetical protein VFV50_02000 [Bdellovibrionales bacterium]|nr:hypothetical protein [Bdellovibrionales bacterium]